MGSKHVFLSMSLVCFAMLGWGFTQRSSALENQQSAAPRILYGREIVSFKPGELVQSVRVNFAATSFAGTPVVVVSESGSAGTYTVCKAEHFDRKGFSITVARFDASKNQRYTAHVGWIAIGKPGAGAS